MLPDGRPVERFVMSNARGMSVSVLTYGGILQSVEVPDRTGDLTNVTLGFASLDGYLDPAYTSATPFFGALIGRYANRIAHGRFTLDGVDYALSINDPPNHLHGGGAAPVPTGDLSRASGGSAPAASGASSPAASGASSPAVFGRSAPPASGASSPAGFDVRVWDAEVVPGGVRLSLLSPAGSGGYPGTLRVVATYALEASANVLRISYEATTDAPTIVNLTNHAYWNLAGEGEGTIYGHRLQVNASRYTPVDDTAIPTGELAPVAGTRFDFTRPRELGDGFDHNWVLDDAPVAAILAEPSSGRVLTIVTDQPGIQVYSGNFLDGTLRGAGGRPYVRGAGVALETQHFPDSPNHPAFPTTILRPGEAFRSTTSLRFTTDADR